MVQMTGTYLRTQEEGYEKFLSKLGVGFLIRKAATASTPVMTVTENDGKWKMTLKTVLKTNELNFKIGVEFEEKTADGRHCKTTVTKEGNKLITHQVPIKAGEKAVKVIRDFSDEGIDVEFICEDVVSKQFFKRQ